MGFVRRGRVISRERFENVLQTGKCDEEEVIDKMGKVSLNHVNRLPLENQYFSRWPAKQKHEQLVKFASQKFTGLKNHFSWVSFLRWQRL